MQQLARFRLTQRVVRSICDCKASCFKTTADNRHPRSRKSGKHEAQISPVGFPRVCFSRHKTLSARHTTTSIKANSHRHARHDKSVVFVSRPLRQRELNSRQLRTVADRSLNSPRSEHRPVHTGTPDSSVAEWLACWTQAQCLGSNRSRDAVG